MMMQNEQADPIDEPPSEVRALFVFVGTIKGGSLTDLLNYGRIAIAIKIK